MKKSVTLALGLCMAASLVATKPCSAGFAVGGENGWQLTTDGIVDVFATYTMTSPAPSAGHGGGLLDNGDTTSYNQRFGVGVGLLPSVVAFNIKAPTTNGVDSTVRIGIYPSIQNGNNAHLGLTSDERFSVGPNIDFREMFYTAKGKYGEILAGRALNLYQGKNILTDMVLLTAGTASGRANTVTLGHIGSGYLYTGFGPQMRYTTPDFGGLKFALEVAEPYKIAAETAKTNSPRVEAELSFAKTFGGGVSTQAWLSGVFQTAPRNKALTTARAGKEDETIGGAYGLGFGIKGLNLLVSGYGGKGLGMVSVQDGGVFSNATDGLGHARLYWGFLGQVTYKINPSFMVGMNYGQTRQENTDYDKLTGNGGMIMKHESGVVDLTYNMNAFTQFILEYTYAQDRWQDGATQHTNQIAFGTMFYW
ncbi:MAG: hypothetical protein HXX11_10760 [Desulfuromonadales bacterium]|nr:hypothetical protein [Desulfuromonadales bacterium]